MTGDQQPAPFDEAFDPAFDWAAAEKDLMAGIDSSRPQWARMWNFWLGGRDNYPVDRQVGEQIRTLHPQIIETAWQVRAFHIRAVGHLTSRLGIRRLVDIGIDYPVPECADTHQVAQHIAPTSQVIYVDHDPLVLTHARALLASGPGGACHYLDADLRDPDTIVNGAAALLDGTRPVGVLLTGVLHLLDDPAAHALVGRLAQAMPVGSRIVITDFTDLINPAAMHAATATWNAAGGTPMTLRDPIRISRLFHHPALTSPPVISCSRWLPQGGPGPFPQVDAFAAIGAVTRGRAC